MNNLYNGINASELEPSEFSVGQNYPNPFKGKTIIKYCVAYKTRVKLTIYNEEGVEIEKLVDEEQNPGTYEVIFQSAVGSRQLAIGNYHYCLEADDYKCEKTMQLLK
jgi:hypothetical protein